MGEEQKGGLQELNGIYKETDDLYHEVALEMGLSDSAFDILYTVCQEGDGCLQRDVCKLCYTRKQTVNSAIRKLEREGYLMLKPGKGRDMHIFLTASGEKLIKEKIQPVAEREEAAFFQLSERERAELLRLNKKYLRQLREQLKQMQ